MIHQVVDRILRQQKSEREGTEKEAEKARAEASLINPELIREDHARCTDEDPDSTNEESATPKWYGGSSFTTGKSRKFRPLN